MYNIQYSKCTTENLRVYFKERAVPEDKLLEERPKLFVYSMCASITKIILAVVIFVNIRRDIVNAFKSCPTDVDSGISLCIAALFYIATGFGLFGIYSLILTKIVAPFVLPNTTKQDNLKICEKYIFEKYGKFFDFQDVLRTKQIEQLRIVQGSLIAEYVGNSRILQTSCIPLSELAVNGIVVEDDLDFGPLDAKIQETLCEFGLQPVTFP